MRRLKELSLPQGRKDSSMLLLEGTHLLQEIIRVGRNPSELILTEQWAQKNNDLMQRFTENIRITKVTAEVLQSSLTTKNPDGVASLLPFTALPKEHNDADFILALDRLQDPGNLGTIFRNALAAEIGMVWIALGADPFGQKALRASAGAILELPFSRFANSEESAINKLAKKLELAYINGYQVIASCVPSARMPLQVTPYWEIDWQKPTVLVLGNEGNGLHPKIQACCSCGVTLPHSNAVQSLNVASASVPLMLERYRAKITSSKV